MWQELSVRRHGQAHTLFGGPVESTMSKSEQDCCYPVCSYPGGHHEWEGGVTVSVRGANLLS
jgi:hypothetical protein